MRLNITKEYRFSIKIDDGAYNASVIVKCILPEL